MMATRLGLLIPLLLLCEGCVPGNDPLLPELKGRWSASNAVRLRHAAAAERYANPPAVIESGDCRNEYVTFEKYGVVIYVNGQVSPVFMVQSVKREGARLILDGNAPLLAGGHSGRIELVLRNGEVRLDDVINERGRSILSTSGSTTSRRGAWGSPRSGTFSG